ncbi:MAG TPA: hypothetical protein VF989_18930 [Polyangiaceae bacterium]
MRQPAARRSAGLCRNGQRRSFDPEYPPTVKLLVVADASFAPLFAVASRRRGVEPHETCSSMS